MGELNKKIAETELEKEQERIRYKYDVTDPLIEKISKWLNLRGLKYEIGVWFYYWRFDKGGKRERVPNFPNDLNACFKYVVPKSKMDMLWIINNLDAPTSKIEYCFGFLRYDLICWSKDLLPEECLSPVEETASMAVCKAVEKLIDKKEKK